MTITRYQLPKKIMILCAWGEKRMNLGISGLRQSSFFTSQVEWLVNGRSNALVLAWKYQDLTQLNGDSAASSECLLVLRKAIVRAVELEGFSGVLVLHDADTLAYSAAAMSFLLSGLPAAIVFTGGLLPVDADESDVWENITGALMLLIEGVADGGRPRKLSATPDLSGTVLPLCPIPNSALKSARSFSSVKLKASPCAALLA